MRLLRTLMAMLAVPASLSAQPLPDEPHIYVEGEHTESAEADRFSIRVSISEVAPTSSAAANAVAERLGKLIDVAESLGIDESQIRAFQVEVAPERRWENGKEQRLGTRVTRELQFSHDQVASMQRLLDALIQADIAAIHETRAFSSQEATLHDRAVEGAVRDARARAERIAASLGAKVGPVHSVSEFAQHYRPMQLSEFSYALKRERPRRGKLRPGPVEVTAHVYVVFLLNQ